MGKPTGFMEYDRVDKKAQSPKERIKHFNEFHTPLSKEEQQRQDPFFHFHPSKQYTKQLYFTTLKKGKKEGR